MRIIATTTRITNMETVSTNHKKTIDSRCLKCFNQTYQRLSDKFKLDNDRRLRFMVFFQECLLTHKNLSPPEIQSILSERFCEIAGVPDLYKTEKTQSNLLALNLYDTWMPKVKNADNSFDMALRLTIAGNIMDYGANNDFDVNQTIAKVMASPFAIDNSEMLRQRIANANNILYLGDNAGEIVFDRLFIETCLTDKNVSFAVRGFPVLNDVTEVDALEIGMDKVAKIISNGSHAPSTLLSQCGYDFKTAFNAADLIISKGQGNFEGLYELNDSRIFFLMMVKCDVIAELAGVNNGDFVVYNKT